MNTIHKKNIFESLGNISPVGMEFTKDLFYKRFADIWFTVLYTSLSYDSIKYFPLKKYQNLFQGHALQKGKFQ